MCVDLKNIERKYQSSSRRSALLTIAGIALVLALGVLIIQLLPAAIDQAFNLSALELRVVSGR